MCHKTTKIHCVEQKKMRKVSFFFKYFANFAKQKTRMSDNLLKNTL